MYKLISPCEINSVISEEVIKEIVEILTDKGLDAAEECEFSYEGKEGFGEGEYTSNIIQKTGILGEMNGNWQTTVTFCIFENHSKVTDEYFYTVSAFED